MFRFKVETWLNRLLDTMRSTVRHEMMEAVGAYEDKPREQWLFDYPAQVLPDITGVTSDRKCCCSITCIQIVLNTQSSCVQQKIGDVMFF